MPVALDLADEQIRTAMQSPAHLKAYLAAADKRYIVLSAEHLVDALPWPDGAELFQQVVTGYRDHRRALPSGWEEKHPRSGEMVPITLEETLSLEEALQAIGQLSRHVDALRKDLAARSAVWKG